MLSFPNYNLHPPVGILCFTHSVVMVVVSNVALVFPWGAPYVLTPSYPESTNLPTSHIQFQRRIHSIAPIPTRIKATFLWGREQLHRCVLFKFGMWNAAFLSLLYAIVYGVKVFSPSPRKESSASQICFGFWSELVHIFVSPIYNTAMCERPLKKKSTSCPNLSLFFVQKIFFFDFRTKISF